MDPIAGTVTALRHEASRCGPGVIERRSRRASVADRRAEHAYPGGIPSPQPDPTIPATGYNRRAKKQDGTSGYEYGGTV